MSEDNLAGISSAITRKLHWFAGCKERDILIHIKKTIDVVEHTLRGFLRAGLINQRLEAEYLEDLLKNDTFSNLEDKTKNNLLKLKEKYDKQPLKALTQEAILKEAHEVQKAMHIFTLAMVTNLIDYITAQWQTEQSTFLQWIVTILRKMISPYDSPEEKGFRPKIKFKDDNRQLDTYTISSIENRFFSENVFSYTIHLMGGRYYPFSQSLDSLFDVDGTGFCYGHVLIWHDLIKQKGHFNALPHVDRNTFAYQKCLQFTNHKIKWTYKVTKHTPSFPIVKDLLRIMRDDRVYMLYTRNSVDDGHAMGIRRIPNSTSIEFYDPNYGIVVFDDPFLFENWFRGFICKYTIYEEQPASMDICSTLILEDYGPQPKNAKPSIPNITWISTTTEALFEKLEKDARIAIINVSSGMEKIKTRKIISGFDGDQSPLKQKELEIFKTLGALDFIPHTKHASEIKNFDWFQEETYQIITKKMKKSQPNNLQNFLQAENKNTNLHQILKQNIASKIDLQIRRLEKSYIGNYSEKIFALETLKQEILKANQTVPLNIIVTHWLRTKSTMSDKTHAEIIGTQRLFKYTLMTKTEEFIQHLLKENEISIYKLSLLRERICLVASQLLGFKEQLPREELLKELNNNQVSFSKEMKKLLSSYDSNNPTILNDVYYQLVNLENKQKVQLDQLLKASP